MDPSPISEHACFNASSDRSTSITRAPWLARRDAVVKPIPLAAPVTMATLSFTVFWRILESGRGTSAIAFRWGSIELIQGNEINKKNEVKYVGEKERGK